MPSSQSTTQDPQQSTRKGRVSAQTSRGAASISQDSDVEEDELFGLVSVLYHALQGASASRKYIGDAQTANDDELKDFFERCRMDDAARASEAKRLLVSRVEEDDDDEDEGNGVQSGGEGEDDEDEDEDEEDDET